MCSATILAAAFISPAIMAHDVTMTEEQRAIVCSGDEDAAENEMCAALEGNMDKSTLPAEGKRTTAEIICAGNEDAAENEMCSAQKDENTSPTPDETMEEETRDIICSGSEDSADNEMCTPE